MKIDPRVIRTERTRRVWTQADLASRAQVDERTIQRLERSGQTSFATLQAVAAAFGISAAELVDQEPTASPLTLPSQAAPLSRARLRLFRVFGLLAIAFTIEPGVRWFGNTGNWPHWQVWFLACTAAGIALIYAYRRLDHRIFGIVTALTFVSMLWWLNITLPAFVFVLTAFLLLSLGRTPWSHTREESTNRTPR